MRRVEVYKAGELAGVLTEESLQSYSFAYDASYLASAGYPISVTLPKRQEPYVSESLFPFFMNMLPEGVNRSTICRLNRIDEKDYFGLLMFFSGKDIIGDVMVKSIV